VHLSSPDDDTLLGEIVDALGWTHTLMLVTFRPGYRAAWMGVSYYRELELGGLTDGDAGELVQHLLGDYPSTIDLRRLVHERTRGNPFFVEQLAQSLVEHGVIEREATEAPWRLAQPVTDLAIPASVQALVAARIDRLADDDKRILLAASVIGQSFAPAVLRELLASSDDDVACDRDAIDRALDAGLARLEAMGFFARADPAPGAEVAFRHPLTQAVAYGSQLEDARIGVHLAVARALQTLYAAAIGRYASLLAYHYMAAKWSYEAARWRRRAALRVTHIELPRGRPGRRS
jgi:adenylate cyclase